MEENTHVTLAVFDLAGKHICTLFNEEVEAGKQYTMEFDGKDLGNGMYFYKVITPAKTYTGKMVLIKW